MEEPAATVVALTHVGAADPARIGGKARGFGVLARAGLAIPEGVVLTTAAHRAYLAGRRMPEAVAREVARFVEAAGGAPLAVRSSASAEDGADHSYAGQYLTRLGVRGVAETLDAVRACWESAEGAEARAYRLHRGDDDGPVAMAVIVQRLVPAEAAGVCMSVDPVTGDRGTFVVNAAHGLGELVVAGLVTPDDYRLARDDGRVLHLTPGEMDVMLVMSGDGPVQVEVPPGRRHAPVLAGGHLRALHAGLLACEEVLGAPVDCEFGVVDGGVVWLQCRPVTALAPFPADPVAPPTPSTLA